MLFHVFFGYNFFPKKWYGSQNKLCCLYMHISKIFSVGCPMDIFLGGGGGLPGLFLVTLQCKFNRFEFHTPQTPPPPLQYLCMAYLTSHMNVTLHG